MTFKLDKSIVAISALAAIEIVALIKDLDGAMLASVVGAIAAIAGYQIGVKKSGDEKD